MWASLANWSSDPARDSGASQKIPCPLEAGTKHHHLGLVTGPWVSEGRSDGVSPASVMQTCLSPGACPRGEGTGCKRLQSSCKLHKTLGRNILLQESEKLVTPRGGRGSVLFHILPQVTECLAGRGGRYGKCFAGATWQLVCWWSTRKTAPEDAGKQLVEFSRVGLWDPRLAGLQQLQQ